MKNPHEELAHFQAVQTLRLWSDFRNDPSIYLDKMKNLIEGLILKFMN